MTKGISFSPAGIAYVQLYTGLSFIGRVVSDWQADEEELHLVSALQVVFHPIPMQGPQGQIAIRVQPVLMPVNHLVSGPDEVGLPYAMMLTVAEPGMQHPLIQMYVKQSSGIQLAGA